MKNCSIELDGEIPSLYKTNGEDGRHSRSRYKSLAGSRSTTILKPLSPRTGAGTRSIRMAMMTEKVWAALDSLLDYAKNCELLHPQDETFARNSLLTELKLESYEKQKEHYDFPECLNILCDYAAEQGQIHDTIAERDLFDTKLMGCVTPRPSEVVRKFWSLYVESPKKATDYFYKLSQDCNYIRRDRIAKDAHWVSNTKYGELEISINLSKPEKDPRDIAAAKLKKASG